MSPRLSVLVLTAPPFFHANFSSAACLSALQPPTLLSPVQLPTVSTGSRRQLSFASPYHFRVRRDFMSKNPLSGFAPKQTIESSALAAYPHSATFNQITRFNSRCSFVNTEGLLPVSILWNTFHLFVFGSRFGDIRFGRKCRKNDLKNYFYNCFNRSFCIFILVN